MYISSIKIHNYKSFAESEIMHLTPGFNIITGQNNVGKTALIEALSGRFDNKPHRSMLTIPQEGSHPNQASWTEVQLVVSEEDFFRALLTPQTTFQLPVPAHTEPEYEKYCIYQQSSGTISYFVKSSFFQAGPLEYKIKVYANGAFIVLNPFFYKYNIATQGSSLLVDTFCVDSSSSIKLTNNTNSSDAFMSLNYKNGNRDISIDLYMSIYVFRAERFNVGFCSAGSNTELLPFANNLPEVLSVLQSNYVKFKQFNEAVNRVLPQIHHVSVKPIWEQKSEITIWPVASNKSVDDYAREDLAFPLDECGSGHRTSSGYSLYRDDLRDIAYHPNRRAAEFSSSRSNS